jgi:hypothetical protein
MVAAAAAAPPEPARSIEVGANGEFRLNGRPFLPITGWLQGPANLPKLADAGMNAIAGYHRGADGRGALGTADAYGKAAGDAGLYFFCGYDRRFPEEMERVRALGNVLGWMQHDEPDLPSRTNDVRVAVKSKLAINPSRPLMYLADGDPKTSAVFAPMAGAEVEFVYPKAVTVTRVALGNGPDGAKAKELSLSVDGKEVLRATLPADTAMHPFPLATPATFQSLALKILSVHEGAKVAWGTFTGVDGFDESGANVLGSPSRLVPQQSPAQTREDWKALKALDPRRPVLLTFCSMFFSEFHNTSWWTTPQARELYPQYVGCADAYGIDIYPIYGWNQPRKIGQVARAAAELRALVGPGKPLYQWIETLEGGFGDKAHPVTGREIRNEVYQALASGCTAIGYFTHRFKPTFAEFGVSAENAAALRTLNAEITALGPALLGPDAPAQPTLEIAGGLASVCHAKSDGKTVTVIAVNMDGENRGGEGTFRLPGLKAGTPVAVCGENRALTAGDGQWQDAFGSLAAHVYQFPQP